MADFIRRFARPARKQSIFRTDRAGASAVGRVFCGLTVCLIVTAFLSSQRMVSMAERLEFGTNRDRWLSAAEAVDTGAAALRLDRPAQAVEQAIGRSSGNEPAEVVLGELATASASSPTNTEPTTTPTNDASPQTIQGAAPGGNSAEDRTTPTATLSTTELSTTGVPASTTIAPPPRILGDASINDPLQIWVGGDSLGDYVGSQLLYQVADSDLSDVELEFEISTGLTRPDYFDWPARLSEVMQSDTRPDVVVFMVGGNDDQGLRVDDERISIGTDPWRLTYQQRVATMMDIAAYPDVQMLWINLPPMRDDRREAVAVDINAALEAEASIRPWVDIIDIIDMFTGPAGGYEQFIDEPDGSSTRKARANDGVHITRSASEWVAELVWSEVVRQWRFDYLTPPTTTPSPQPAPEPSGDEGTTTETTESGS